MQLNAILTGTEEAMRGHYQENERASKAKASGLLNFYMPVLFFIKKSLQFLFYILSRVVLGLK